MAYMAPFGIGLLGNCITLIIKPKEGKSLSIISVRNFNKKRMEDHKYSKIFNHIKELNPTMDFEASITGNFRIKESLVQIKIYVQRVNAVREIKV